MNIIQINTSDIRGGAAKVAYRLQQALIAQGHQSDMFVGVKTSRDPNVHHISTPSSMLQIIGKLIGRKNFAFKLKQKLSYWLANDLTLYPESKHILNAQQFRNADIVHCHNLHSYYFNLDLLPRIARSKPIIWTFHDMWPITPHCAHAFDGHVERGFFTCPNTTIYPPIAWHHENYLTRKKADIYEQTPMHIVVPSQWLKEKVEQSILKTKPISLIYNGVDTDIFKPSPQTEARDALNLPHDKKILLFLAKGGKHNPWKGWSHFEKIVHHYSGHHNVLFLMVGTSHIHQENMMSVPYIADESHMAQCYSAADILIYPSIADNCPLTVLEAQACGLPVAAFATGGIPELVKHKETGYIALYKDTADLIAGIDYLITLTPDHLEHMRSEAISHIQNNFTLQKMTQAYLDLYNALSNKKPRM